jgi:hypothetical protein
MMADENKNGLSTGDMVLLSLGIHESQRLRAQRTMKGRGAGDIQPVSQQELSATPIESRDTEE